MRTAVFLGLSAIAKAIRPDVFVEGAVVASLVMIACVLMDIIEFAGRLKTPR